MPGTPERRTHDYACHGTTSLFAAFNFADGTVICELHRLHRTVEVSLTSMAASRRLIRRGGWSAT